MRSADGLPGDWIERIKESIKTLTPRFSTTRMVKQYMNELYLPAMQMTEEEPEKEKA